jgi:hypothetical protein
MIKLNSKQLKLLEKSADIEYVKRIEKIMFYKHEQLLKEKTSSEINQILNECLSEARDLYIEIESDVFEYTLLRLIYGKNFLALDKVNYLRKRLLSPYVPSNIKIKKLKAVFPILENT